ncbi:MAG: hypothetical protein B7733_21245 [Myxococcales bacterium FL481]|nr:MAG: hypothetical protein B7733_21245 [Myxococcales bacterium FL481]
MTRKFCSVLLTTALACLPGCGDKDKAEDAKAKDSRSDVAASKRTGKTGKKGKKAQKKKDEASESSKVASPEPKAPTTAAGHLQWLKYVPAEADSVGQIDIKRLSSTEIWKSNREALTNDVDGRRVLAALEACKLDVDALESLTLGRLGEQLVLVIVGPGLTKIDNFACMRDAVKADGQADAWKVEERDGEKVVVFANEAAPEQPMVGRIANGEAFVVANEGWQTAVKALIAGSGKPASGGPLKDLVARADTSRTVWLATKLSSEDRNQLEPPFNEIQDVVASLDLGKGLALDVGARVGDAKQVDSIKTQAEVTYSQYKGLALMMGVPESITNKVAFSAKGDQVVMSLALTEAERTQLETLGEQAVAAQAQAAAAPTSAGSGATAAPGAGQATSETGSKPAKPAGAAAKAKPADGAKAKPADGAKAKAADAAKAKAKPVDAAKAKAKPAETGR